MKIFLSALILLSTTGWFFLTQPLFSKQKNNKSSKHISSDNLEKQVSFMVETFNDRGYTNTDMLDSMASYIYNEFEKYSTNVNYQAYKAKDPIDGTLREYKNVIAHFKGREESNEIIVVGGHYDTYAGHAGANDNTSAVAALLELARVLKENPPKYDLQVVAYTLEEPPFFRTKKMGSYIHAQNLDKEGKDVKLAIVLDMIGFFSDEEDSQKYPIPLMKWFYPSTANYISIVSNLKRENIKSVRKAKKIFKKTTDLPVHSVNAFKIIPGIDFSDHSNYWKFDYPALLITDTAFYRSDNYHTENDTPDTLDYNNMAKVVEGVFALVQ